MLGFVDHLSTGQFFLVCLGLFWILYELASAAEQWHLRRLARRRAEAFASDHRGRTQLAAGAPPKTSAGGTTGTTLSSLRQPPRRDLHTKRSRRS